MRTGSKENDRRFKRLNFAIDTNAGKRNGGVTVLDDKAVVLQHGVVGHHGNDPLGVQHIVHPLLGHVLHGLEAIVRRLPIACVCVDVDCKREWCFFDLISLFIKRLQLRLTANSRSLS